MEEQGSDLISLTSRIEDDMFIVCASVATNRDFVTFFLQYLSEYI